MLHCLNTSGNLGATCSDMTVLERQREATIKWQQHLQNNQPPYLTDFNVNVNAVFSSSSSSSQSQGLVMNICADSALGEVLTHSVKPDPGVWPEFDAGFGSSSGFLPTISPTCSRGGDLVSPKENMASAKENTKKRKPQNSKVVVAASDNKQDKRVKASGEEGESKVTEQTSNKNGKSNANKNNNRETTSAETSKDNSKGSEVQNQKPEYIHVRARRGQATDSHSLAERVRREKISERMKYLQDLVPGCNKVAGKAGMLDEIINYVQSLQRQVEFLSMKLAAVNPRLDFNLDELFTKEVFPSCAQSFPNIGMPLDMSMSNNPSYLPFNSAQQLVSCCGGLINNMGISPPNMGLRRNISTSPVPLPETFLDSSCFTQILPSSNWEGGDFQSLYNVAFDQGRTASFPSQPFTGLVEASNLKMEM
ncbi:hypothetical protein AAZX31_11G115100 [Glycine max]|uniref:Basic helix-loop-helix transcription activator CIB1 n=2 Tax=Glycine subgen. Soja TaxID=1462606 RepID=K7LP95_SOYBN|nr:basic helix-loop-helix transcription activator CIB1 isoform X1 [Glycine max]XP_028187331.1 transcription factor HBI1-like isoform X1 [Glycine soja]KAH1158709.1 hypothetical protein GYH30_030764 [Glycine max]KRH29448.1 hypothetical protein GLYMA_11G117100v4 [Glycine max]RZB79506.1 Transcription factor bHLH49 isoform A [Glycine soja]|eukprot:XP_006590895.1 basic helix-loop-helix transcription activator CIB1 isoform X1 [Glycine max]